MSFNSLDFAIFLPTVFFLYWFVTTKHLKSQNLLIVSASYMFYGWWDWRFLILIIFSTIIDFSIGILLNNTENKLKRKSLLCLSIGINLGLLGFFKYYNFFVDSFTSAFTWFGQDIKPNTLDIILPVGISFYTFQTLSYTMDVYRKNLKPTFNIISFSAFVSFFPQLVAGPIERATHLLPQFYKQRQFNYNHAIDGLRQILWGFFKKIVIADNCARFANDIFNNSQDFNGSTLFLGALFFTFQIYGDFSGYSDIAIGTSRLFGFNLKQNFASPYFSRDIAEFWRRWHISLSTWFRDYLYIPLGGSRGSKLKVIRNVFIIFIVSGFWHGANFTFLVWGFLNACYFLPILLSNKNRTHLEIVAKGYYLPSLKEFTQILFTFILTVFAWIFFRANNIDHALNYFGNILSWSLFELPKFQSKKDGLITLALIGLFIIVEWIGREGQHTLELIGSRWKRSTRHLMYYLILLIIFWFGGQDQEFIYFQF
ncbi:MBOAT family O-acyltransferase [Winogradskyella undariae]|uniref:MBOAT family O-acyltransferase n=1 Tax=Winogradskyella undariae TaxID=1285465 RepID=UPI0015CDEA3F|nr:MBOAT family protein [Winogradskyella undariae]